MTDYYQLLEIDPTTSSDEIRAAIRKVRRMWSARSTNPNADIRAEAEQRIRDIAQAEKILLDENARANYDATLVQGGNTVPDEAPTAYEERDDDTWITEADELNRRGNYTALVQLMQSVVGAQPKNAFAWYVLGDANYSRNDLSEAERCCWESIRLRPSSHAYKVLGYLYSDCERFDDYYQCFRQAAELDPEELDYLFGCADALRLMGRVDEALALAEKTYQKDPEGISGRGRYAYYLCLRDAICHAASYNRNSGRYLITNRRQLEYVKQYLPRLSAMVDRRRKDDARVEEELRQMVIAAEKTSGLFAKPGYVKNYETSSDEVRKSGLQ